MAQQIHVAYPHVPGVPPSVRRAYDTLAEAREHAVLVRHGRKDLRRSDVRIETADGRLIEYAGPNR